MSEPLPHDLARKIVSKTKQTSRCAIADRANTNDDLISVEIDFKQNARFSTANQSMELVKDDNKDYTNATTFSITLGSIIP